MHRKQSLVSRPELVYVYGRAWNVGAREYEQESVGIEQQQCGTWGGNKQASALGGFLYGGPRKSRTGKEGK